jgi:hypothetical protein
MDPRTCPYCGLRFVLGVGLHLGTIRGSVVAGLVLAALGLWAPLVRPVTLALRLFGTAERHTDGLEGRIDDRPDPLVPRGGRP